MKDINNLVLLGRLTHDLNERSFTVTKAGLECLTFSVASNYPVKNANGEWEEAASFFDVEIWGNRAKWLSSHLSKGQAVLIEGKIRQERWRDRQTGYPRSRVKIVADEIGLLLSKSESGATQAVAEASAEEQTEEFTDDWPPF